LSLFVPSFLLPKKILLERPGPLLQPFHVGPFYFPPHLLTKGENKTTLLKFTERILHYQALDFSLGYLQKTMQALSKQGLIECKRGRIGGMRLKKRKITLLDIWNVTSGQIDADPAVPALKKPLKAFADAMKKVIVCK